MGHVINYLLTGCSCRTSKYKPLVFQTALGFPNSPCKLGLYEKPWACVSWYGPCTQLVNSNYCTPDTHGDRHVKKKNATYGSQTNFSVYLSYMIEP